MIYRIWAMLLILTLVPAAPLWAVGTPGILIEARLLGNATPDYPREALVRGIEGRVIVWIQISAEGDVLEVRLHESSGERILDQATLRFSKTLKFRPAMRGRTPIPTTVLLPVRYRLVDGS